MRKLISLILCVLLMFVLIACQNTTEANNAETVAPSNQYGGSTVFTFPEGTVLCGFDLSGKLGNTAYKLISKAAKNYTLTLRVNDEIVVIPGTDMGLTYHEEAVTAYIDAIKNGEDPTGIQPITYNPKQLQSRIAYHINKMPTDISVSYDQDLNAFVVTDFTPGTVYDLAPVIEELEPVILSFTPGHSTTAQGYDTDSAITAESSNVNQALDAANAVVRTALTYCYTPTGSKTTYEALTVDDIAGFLTIDENLKVNPCGSAC